MNNERDSATKRKRQTRAERRERKQERDRDYLLPLCAPFADKPKSWWSGVIDEYIIASNNAHEKSGPDESSPLEATDS